MAHPGGSLLRLPHMETPKPLSGSPKVQANGNTDEQLMWTSGVSSTVDLDGGGGRVRNTLPQSVQSENGEGPIERTRVVLVCALKPWNV